MHRPQKWRSVYDKTESWRRLLNEIEWFSNKGPMQDTDMVLKAVHD